AVVMDDDQGRKSGPAKLNLCRLHLVGGRALYHAVAGFVGALVLVAVLLEVASPAANRLHPAALLGGFLGLLLQPLDEGKGAHVVVDQALTFGPGDLETTTPFGRQVEPAAYLGTTGTVPDRQIDGLGLSARDAHHRRDLAMQIGVGIGAEAVGHFPRALDLGL